MYGNLNNVMPIEDVEPIILSNSLLNFVAHIALIVGIINIIMLLIKNKKVNKLIVFIIEFNTNMINYAMILIRGTMDRALGYEPTITERIFNVGSPIFILTIQIIIFIYLIVTIMKTKKEVKKCQE